ncbi:unnamed protein product [Prorocentrum cordatum]|uniref:Exostosin GT47 domain-containing protein n=1 Tax=Prorocentrum cordatum TaxID=2364126 RepID=A0ABN9RBH1_9DINO|nr:unnamed protein product [Polarella glacialis]
MRAFKRALDTPDRTLPDPSEEPWPGGPLSRPSWPAVGPSRRRCTISGDGVAVPEKWPPLQPQDPEFFAFIKRYPMCRGVGGLPDMFDWYARTPKAKVPTKDPRTVWGGANHEAVEHIIETLEENFPHGRQDRSAYFTGDMFLSMLDEETIERLKKLFKGGLFFQAKDIPWEGVTTAPVGLNEYYFRKTWDVAEKAIAAASVDAKPYAALGAWGYMRKLGGIKSRQLLQGWVETEAAKAAGVQHRMIEPREYFSELAKYKFLLAPGGGGILSPKTDEALLVLTVPIVIRDGYAAYDDWPKLGWPIVILDAWEEVTAENLDTWWAKFSPRLLRFRENCLTSEGFFKLVTGTSHYCE